MLKDVVLVSTKLELSLKVTKWLIFPLYNITLIVHQTFHVCGTDGWTDRLAETNRLTDPPTHKDWWKGRETDWQTERQTDRGTDMQTQLDRLDWQMDRQRMWLSLSPFQVVAWRIFIKTISHRFLHAYKSLFQNLLQYNYKSNDNMFNVKCFNHCQHFWLMFSSGYWMLCFLGSFLVNFWGTFFKTSEFVINNIKTLNGENKT